MQPATRWRAAGPGARDTALRDRRAAVQAKIQREFEELSAAALKARSQKAVEPMPEMPRVAQSTKVDGLRTIVLGTRLLGVCPVYLERAASRVPLTPTSLLGSDRAAALPQYRPSWLWAAYSCCVFTFIFAINCYLTLNTLRALNDPDIATGLINVLSAVAYFASCINALAMVAGARRKYQLLPRLLNWPVCSAATAYPNALTLLLYVGSFPLIYVITDFHTILRVPVVFVLFFSAMVSLVERLLLMFLAGRALRCFRSVNKELRQLGILFRDRMHLQYVPDAAAKITQLRAQHEKIANFLELTTQVYELQVIGILLYDFGTTVLTMYEFIVYLSRLSAARDPDNDDYAVIFLLNVLYSSVVTTCLCRACYWTHREGRMTHALVHKALSCMTISEDECLQLTIFSLQLMNKYFIVSPLGILNLDNSLLASFSLGVVMYVLVLVQFGGSAPVGVNATTPFNSTPFNSTPSPWQ